MREYLCQMTGKDDSCFHGKQLNPSGRFPGSQHNMHAWAEGTRKGIALRTANKSFLPIHAGLETLALKGSQQLTNK